VNSWIGTSNLRYGELILKIRIPAVIVIARIDIIIEIIIIIPINILIAGANLDRTFLTTIKVTSTTLNRIFLTTIKVTSTTLIGNSNILLNSPLLLFIIAWLSFWFFWFSLTACSIF